MKSLKTYFADFAALAFPEECRACGATLHRQEQVLCTYCRQHLPYTNFHLDRNNYTAKQFWGRVDVKAAASFLYFKKGERVQRLLHQLKYRKQPEIGLYLGKLYGNILKELGDFAGADLICPLPLHRERLRTRGYNQSECFASGLGLTMQKAVDGRLLSRQLVTESQTTKSRYDRFLNIGNAFRVQNPLRLQGRHVLLVDDVVTTGATLAACATEILKIAGTSVSIATIAYAP